MRTDRKHREVGRDVPAEPGDRSQKLCDLSRTIRLTEKPCRKGYWRSSEASPVNWNDSPFVLWLAAAASGIAPALSHTGRALPGFCNVFPEHCRGVPGKYPAPRSLYLEGGMLAIIGGMLGKTGGSFGKIGGTLAIMSGKRKKMSGKHKKMGGINKKMPGRLGKMGGILAITLFY